MGMNYRWYLKHVFSLYGMEVFKSPDLTGRPALVSRSDMEISPLKREDIPELMELHDAKCIQWNHVFTREDVEERLSLGHICMCARHEGRLAAFVWLAPQRVFSPEMRCIIEVPSTGVFDYNGFVDPACRSMNVAVTVLDESCRMLAERGYKNVYSYFRISNHGARKVNSRNGFVPCGRILYGYLLGYFYIFPFLKGEPCMRVRPCGSPWHRWQIFARKRGLAA